MESENITLEKSKESLNIKPQFMLKDTISFQDDVQQPTLPNTKINFPNLAEFLKSFFLSVS